MFPFYLLRKPCWKIFFFNIWAISLYLITISSFFVLQGSDPGYLDEKACARAANISLQEESLLSDEENFSGEDGNLDRGKNFLNARECRFCCFLVPLRSHHCKYCNKCVGTFDHHCHILGTCIGEKNNCRFWWFLMLHFLAIWVLMDILAIAYDDAEKIRKLRSLEVFDITYILLNILWLYFGALLATHTWFAVSSMNTFEIAKGTRKFSRMKESELEALDLPFSRGILGNLFGYCCKRDFFGLYWLRIDWSKLRLHRAPWEPEIWELPPRINHDDELCCDNMWHNRYYSCC